MKKLPDILDVLSLNTHKDVMEYVDSVVPPKLFTKVEHNLFTIYYPTHSDFTYLPVLNSHTDTVHKIKPKSFTTGNGILSNLDKTNGLGADDRAGVYIMAKLMAEQHDEYIYVFTDKEEVGGIGGNALVTSDEWSTLVSKASIFIGLDRRGDSDAASYGYDNEDVFWMLEDLGYKYIYGSFTDVMTFAQNSDIACVNLSIGYDNEHRSTETLNLIVMENTYTVLAEDLQAEFWNTQYKHEVVKGKYSNNVDFKDMYYTDVPEPIFCDCCGQHLPLYDLGWGNVCFDCLEVVK